MKIAIFVIRSHDKSEVVSIKGRVFLDRIPHFLNQNQLADQLKLENIEREMRKDGWELLDTVDLCDGRYFENNMRAELIEQLDNLASRLAASMYFKGSAQGHNEAVMERR